VVETSDGELALEGVDRASAEAFIAAAKAMARRGKP
jgi:hypothetical protein